MITEQEFKNHIDKGTLTLEIVKEWVEGGGNINIQDQYGRTALILASYYGHLDIVQYLVEKGAKIDIQNNSGITALIRASENAYLDETSLDETKSRLEIVKLLVEKGAKIDLQDKYGRTALYHQRKNIQGIKIFLQFKQYSNKIKGLKRKNISFNQFIKL